jgi:hypothetical protein
MVSLLLLLTLPLFVPGVAADDEYSTSTTNQFAVFANSLNAGSNLHSGGISPVAYRP